MLTHNHPGELFLEQPSDELSSLDNLPGFLHDMDHMFFNSTMGWYFPWLLACCKLLPIPALQYRLRATTRMLEVTKNPSNIVRRGFVHSYGPVW